MKGFLARRGGRAGPVPEAVPEPAPAPSATASDPEPVWVEVVAGAVQARLLAAYTAELRTAGLGCGAGGKVNGLRTRLHLHPAEAAAAIALLAAVIDRLGLVVRAQQGTAVVGWDDLRSAAAKGAVRPVNLWVTEHEPVAADGAVRLAAVLEIDAWAPTGSALRDAGDLEAPRSNDVVTALPEPALRRWLSPAGAGEDWPRPLDVLAVAPDLYARDFPIDVVYTWVDGADPVWRASWAEHAGAAPPLVDRRVAAHPERFRSHDELRYSLRSLELYATWVRRVFLVTMGQRPAWLADHPDLEVVDHRDIYSEPEVLPTFNSSSIETQLHHIDGLAEHFVYLNDDVFFGRPCAWNELFLANGLPRLFLADHAVLLADVDDGAAEHLLADRTAERLLRGVTGRSVHKALRHGPLPMRRSLLYDCERRFAAEWQAAQRARFRGPDDLRPIAFLAPHLAFAEGRAVPSRLECRYLALWKPALATQLQGVLGTRRYKTFCLNDAGVPADREDAVAAAVADFLPAYFPVPSRFERPGS